MENKKQITEKMLAKWRSDWKPRSGSGKTKFNRIKAKGESWTELRDAQAKKKAA